MVGVVDPGACPWSRTRLTGSWPAWCSWTPWRPCPLVGGRASCCGYEDLGVEAVAELLGCHFGTVKSQTARGLDALRASYARLRRDLVVVSGRLPDRPWSRAEIHVEAAS